MRIGVDSGGTFTDVIGVTDDGRLLVHKRTSTPAAPAEAVRDGVGQLLARAPAGEAGADTEVIHGTTVATNALLERRGGPTALLATAGFEDLLVLRRHARPRLYDLHPVVPEPLVPEALRFGVSERMAHTGAALKALPLPEVQALVARLRELVARGEVRSVAVALLHAYANDAHERVLGAALEELGVPVSLSSEVLPEHREYERTSTTVVDAYVAPLLREYLAALSAALPALKVMQSSGGAASAREVARRPVRTILSGPAAGVVGARNVAAAAGFGRLITLDMGGTSTDVALCQDEGEAPGAAALVEGLDEVAGHAVRVPALPVHTVGAGGGSIAWCDEGGALKVGPRSAGAAPGPACYGRGGELPTVTDAALLLGRIAPDHFLGGEAAAGFELDLGAATVALSGLAGQLGLSVAETAAGVLRVAAAAMARAIRVVSVERGHDPRDFTLVAFGGAGPLFACDVAAELEIPRVLVPPEPGLLCAYGALVADVTTDHAATRLAVAPRSLPAAQLGAELAPLEAAARADLDAEQVPPGRRRITRRCDLRYQGQAYELSLLLPDGADGSIDGDFDVVAAFHAQHLRRYGFANPHGTVERVALRVEGRGLAPAVPPLQVAREEGPARLSARGPAPVYSRPHLPQGAHIDGPAVLVEYSATTFVAPGWRATVREGGSLLLEPLGP